MTSDAAEKLSAEENLYDGAAPVPCRPFIKWVGGKTQLIPELHRRLPKSFNRYIEPFVGGGALFFSLQPRRAHIMDISTELINAYTVVRDECEALIADLRKHTYEKEYYYHIRDADRHSSFSTWSAIERASRFIYLNKTCYNGLFRVNSRGHFNTPFGRYTNPKIVDHENLRACSRALKAAKIHAADFHSIEQLAEDGDFIYFDPPYMPLTATSSFTSYDSSKFSTQLQKQLFELCCRLDQRGIQFMLSNSSSPFVTMLYQHFRCEFVSANRAINSKAHKRGAVHEVIVRNY